MASQFLDDKSEPCLAFIRSRISLHGNSDKPLVIGLNGLQGVGKTTLVTALAKALQAEGVNTLVLSIDDLYLERKQQALLASSHALNPLVQHRGEPGTHDMVLAKELFGALVVGKETKIPQYNKAAFSGLGDRVPSEQWQTVNAPGQKKVQVIIFEGWCVGFRPLREDQVRARHAGPSKTLHIHRLEDLLFVNARLKEYDAITDYFDGFVYIDAEDTQSVYDWRLQQERALREHTGSGMTDEQVIDFVNGYYPAYELYLDGIRNGVLHGEASGRQLGLVVDKSRRVTQKFIL